MDTLEIIKDYIARIERNSMSKSVLARVYEYNKDFIYLNDQEMISLLINDLKINKVTVVKNYYQTLSLFFRYLKQNGIVEENPFNFISYEEVKSQTAKNLCILTDDDVQKIVERLYDQNSNNAPYKEVVIRLCYECISDSISSILKLKKSDTLLQDNLINGMTISEELKLAILKMYAMDSWLYKEARRDLYSPLEIIDNTRLLPYAARGNAPAESLEKRQHTAHVFIQKYVFNGLELEGYDIDIQILYCCGLTNRIIKDLGKDYFITMFLKKREDATKYFLKDEMYSFKYLKEKYKIKCETDTLKEKMIPYALKILM